MAVRSLPLGHLRGRLLWGVVREVGQEVIHVDVSSRSPGTQGRIFNEECCPGNCQRRQVADRRVRGPLRAVASQLPEAGVVRASRN